jgi:hypothetical protein
MKPVPRSEILDWMTYSEQRDALRPAAIAAKDARRIVLGDGTLVMLFENQDTVRYQVHEMLRTERIVREADILHELHTYNELLGGPGELGCTLLIGIEDPAERDAKLRAWLALPQHLYAELPGGRRVRPVFDERQVGDDRLSSVQYLKFDVGGEVPVALGSDLPGLEVRTELSERQRTALAEDLAQG